MFKQQTEDQHEFAKAVRQFLAKHSPESEVRRLMATEQGFDRETWQKMARELGLQGIGIPEQYGGQGFGWVELGIVLEEMGRVLLCAPFYSTVVLAATAILESGDHDAAAEWLPGIADGSAIATLAFPGQSGVWDATGVTIHASFDGGSYRLTGKSRATIDGHVADWFVVPAITDSGVTLFVVEAGAGVSAALIRPLDETRKLADICFDGAIGRILGTLGDGLPVLQRVLDLAVVGLAAEQAGGARAALDMSVAYMKDRVQFGQPIGAFQSLKHMAADVLIEAESAKSAASYALWAADEAREELPAAASLAAAYCAEAFVTAAHQNIQFHGGMGFTWEIPAHLYFKRARADQTLFGDPQTHREALAQRIGM